MRSSRYNINLCDKHQIKLLNNQPYVFECIFLGKTLWMNLNLAEEQALTIQWVKQNVADCFFTRKAVRADET